MCDKVDWTTLKNTLESTPGLVGAWVFGSAQYGCLKAGSDLDIALWFESAPSLDVLTTLRANLQLALRLEAIDLVVLNGTLPITRFEAVVGRPTFCRDQVACATFVSLTAREHESAMAFLAWGLEQSAEVSSRA